MYTAKDAEELVKRLKVEGAGKAEIVRRLAELCLGWPYVYAAAGEMCTPEWRKNRMQYSDDKYAAAIRDACPVLNGSASSCTGCKWDGCRCFDCRGFTRWLLEQAEITLAGGGATSQWDTASNWVAKGSIDTLPTGLVCCVFKRKDGKMSHTGMSMGDGAGGVIHCSTTVKRGNAYTDYSKWTHLGVPRGLYTTDELRKAGIDVAADDNMPTLRRGNQGDEVADLQTILNARYGADLEVDGNFGKATEAAVKAFQKAHGLTADGIVGAKTWKALGILPGEQNIAPAIPEPDDQPPTICIPYADFQAIKAAVVSAYHIIKKYEGV